jgi:RimJ/RimL family protein N-acetyltransferase
MYREIGGYIIRDWQMEDAPSIAKYANNRKIWMNLRDAFPHPYSLQNAKSFISRAIESDPTTVFAIATQSKAIGSIGLILGKDVHRFTAEIGYWLAESFWGKGIMTQAVKSLTAYAIRELKLQRIFAEPYTTNLASARVLEKAGFICEGILRSNVFKDGKVLDQFLYSYIGNASTQPVNGFKE